MLLLTFRFLKPSYPPAVPDSGHSVRASDFGPALGAADDRPVGDHLHAIPILYFCLVGTERVLGGRSGLVDLSVGQALAIAPGARHAHQPLRTGCVALDLGFLADACDFEIHYPERSVHRKYRTAHLIRRPRTF